jgi:hypothetical protein
MKISLTEFQRNFRKAREAADSGEAVIVKGEQRTWSVHYIRSSHY